MPHWPIGIKIFNLFMINKLRYHKIRLAATLPYHSDTHCQLIANDLSN